jgi:hypothetical protein
MAVVFDEVVGDVQPDDDDGESGAGEGDTPTSPPTIDVGELRRALGCARRRDARLAAD